MGISLANLLSILVCVPDYQSPTPIDSILDAARREITVYIRFWLGSQGFSLASRGPMLVLSCFGGIVVLWFFYEGFVLLGAGLSLLCVL
ncbi:hypothetical protein BDV38DRAFT_260464, partial [Aspergillus pseudotamarii]